MSKDSAICRKMPLHQLQPVRLHATRDNVPSNSKPKVSVDPLTGGSGVHGFREYARKLNSVIG